MSPVTRFGIDFNLRSNQIYLDSATLGKMPISSIDFISEYYKRGGGVPVRGMHSEISNAKKFLEDNRRDLAKLFQVEPIQISFLPTREVTLTNVLYSLPRMKQRRIFTSILEEHSLIAPVIRLKNDFGTKIEYLNLKDEINILDKLNEKLSSKEDVLLLSSLTATNGVKRDWEEISKICKDSGATFILDISYSIGHESMQFNNFIPEIIISSGCIGALGPPGIAFQITSNQIYNEMNPLIVGGGSIITLEEEYYLLSSSSSKFENGLLSCANIGAMVNSLNKLSNVGFSRIKEHEGKLNYLLRKGLRNFENIILNEVENAQYGPIISFGSKEFEAHDLALILEDLRDIQVRSGGLCSHLFMYELEFSDIVRISTHLYNTEEEIKIFLETLSKLN